MASVMQVGDLVSQLIANVFGIPEVTALGYFPHIPHYSVQNRLLTSVCADLMTTSGLQTAAEQLRQRHGFAKASHGRLV